MKIRIKDLPAILIPPHIAMAWVGCELEVDYSSQKSFFVLFEDGMRALEEKRDMDALEYYKKWHPSEYLEFPRGQCEYIN